VGRDPTNEERALVPVGLARRLAESEEHAALVGPDVTLVGSQSALRANPPGMTSEDGVARVGDGGRLFLVGGSNDPIAQMAGT